LVEDAIADFQNRHVERAAAEVIDSNRAGFFLLVEAISQCGGCRLVDDAQYFKAGDLAGVFGCLALSVVEVGWNRDDSLRDLLAEFGFCALFHFLQNES
jgi:NAD-specific glutamate dehydrogenase